jgi:purine nucleosidase
VRTFLIETDTASDDAVAILMALAAPDVKVAALTVVPGNVSIAQRARNALYTCEVAGVDVPVHPGAEAPLTAEAEPQAIRRRGRGCRFPAGESRC